MVNNFMVRLCVSDAARNAWVGRCGWRYVDVQVRAYVCVCVCVCVIPTNPTDSRGSLPIFYSSQRIPILLVRHTAFGNCYWKTKIVVFFQFCVRFSLPRSYYTQLLLHSTTCRRLRHFASFF